ncbi:hypothetical protein N0V94_000041 [Neodidymelliopsis sp. IMI 364377]|nr:hypothetical protein N0V94_000041 [Neodidymelliopsis sp. IMI 364377]
MRAEQGWRPTGLGVMVYMPAEQVDLHEAQESLEQLSVTERASQVTDDADLDPTNAVLPPIEDSFEFIDKTEIEESYSFGSFEYDLPGTLAAMSEDEQVLTPTSLRDEYNEDIFEQLVAQAGITDSKIDSSRQSSSIPSYTSDADSASGFESDRTDFLLSRESPTLRKSKKVPRRTPSQKRRHFRQNAHRQDKPSVARRLDFGSRTTKRSTRTIKRTPNAQSLENLRNLERPTPHRWDEDERELLCVMNRWYCARDRATELLIFAKIWNAITGLDIRPHIIRNQYENHLRLFGGEAYPELGRVFATPFHDPDGRYAEIRTLIESEAETLGLNLQRRGIDTTIPSGKAKFARSPRTRSIYKALVRKVSRGAKREAVGTSISQDIATSTRSIVTAAIAVRPAFDDDWEIVTNVENSPAPRTNNVHSPIFVSQKPHLSFRVWDASSRTRYVDGNFVAQTFVDWPRPFPPPIALDDPSQAGTIFTVLHLSKRGDTPVFISTASHKVHHAAEVFPWLKSQGLARWARYRGNGEYFVWSDIPSDAVLQTMDLNGLLETLNDDPDCQALLNLHVFEPGTKTNTNTIASALRERNTTLNTTTTRALGKIAKAFGMTKPTITLPHVQDFIARLIDGWTIRKSPNTDIHTMSSIAATFSIAMGTHQAGYTVQDVMGAFVNGVDDGTRCIAHWSRSGSGSRRKRFRAG